MFILSVSIFGNEKKFKTDNIVKMSLYLTQFFLNISMILQHFEHRKDSLKYIVSLSMVVCSYWNATKNRLKSCKKLVFTNDSFSLTRVTMSLQVDGYLFYALLLFQHTIKKLCHFPSLIEGSNYGKNSKKTLK